MLLTGYTMKVAVWTECYLWKFSCIFQWLHQQQSDIASPSRSSFYHSEPVLKSSFRQNFYWSHWGLGWRRRTRFGLITSFLSYNYFWHLSSQLPFSNCLFPIATRKGRWSLAEIKSRGHHNLAGMEQRVHCENKGVSVSVLSSLSASLVDQELNNS